MPDPNNSGGSKSKSLPNFYSAVGGMDKYSGASGAKPPAQSAADNGEKVKNVTTLLEVIKKMDALESDPENKKLLEQVAGLVEQYMSKLQPGAGPGAGTMGGADKPKPGGADGASASPGATMGDTTAASAAM